VALLSTALSLVLAPAYGQTPPSTGPAVPPQASPYLPGQTAPAVPPQTAPGQFKDIEARPAAPLGAAVEKEIREASQALTKNSKDALSYERLSAAYIRAGEYQKAVDAAAKALALDGKLASSYAQRGYAYYKLGKLKAALADLNKALQLNPRLAAAYVCRSGVYCKMEQYGKALADANAALKLNPKDPAAHVAYSRAAHPLGRYGAAVAAASRAIKMNPNDPTGWDNRGLAYTQLNQFTKAIADFNQALKLRPSEPKYLCHRGIVYLMMGDYPRALKDLTEAIRLKPDYSLAHFNRGVAFYLMGKYELSHNDIKTAIHYDPHYALAWYIFPLDPLKGPKQKEPMDNPSDYYYRATTRILLLRNELAISDLKKYLELAGWQADLSQNAVLLLYLGYERTHKDAQARAILDEAAAKCDRTKWPWPVIAYLRGEAAEADLIKQAADVEQQTEARSIAGLHQWFSQKKNEAMGHFNWLKINGHGAIVTYSLALRELEKLNEKKTQETERFYEHPIH
jgi:tetratricopeptide (TPR) repeat protein